MPKKVEETAKKEVEEVLIEEQPETKQESETVTEVPVESLEDLKKRRMGTFKIKAPIGELSYLKNMLNKVEWKGPQQAYLLLIAKAELHSILAGLSEKNKNDEITVDVSSATIESLSFFMNNKTGVGTESAQLLFSASMILRQAMIEINKIDRMIQAHNISNKDE
jgi:hypothetical protein